MADKVEIIHDGHRDVHYPSWGFRHLSRPLDGPLIGRIVPTFADEPLPVGTVVDTHMRARLRRALSSEPHHG